MILRVGGGFDGLRVLVGSLEYWSNKGCVSVASSMVLVGKGFLGVLKQLFWLAGLSLLL
jgi:hypothetical protein